MSDPEPLLRSAPAARFNIRLRPRTSDGVLFTAFKWILDVFIEWCSRWKVNVPILVIVMCLVHWYNAPKPAPKPGWALEQSRPAPVQKLASEHQPESRYSVLEKPECPFIFKHEVYMGPDDRIPCYGTWYDPETKIRHMYNSFGVETGTTFMNPWDKFTLEPR